MTLLRSRGQSHVALQFRERLIQSRIFSPLYSSPQIETATFQIFRSYQDKEWSYTDCALLATAKHLGATQIFSFDHHVTQMGVSRVP